MDGKQRNLGMPHIAAAWMVILVGSILWHESDAAGQASGRDIYNFRCYFCHGYSGTARTLAAEMLSPTPRDFTATAVHELSRGEMVAAVRDGKPGTAMKPFASLLSEEEIRSVVEFVRDEFMIRAAPNTRYHTVANGWADHERFAKAFPFVKGEIPLSADEMRLTPEQRTGRTLYLTSCISCHDMARRPQDPPSWEAEAVSYPRTGFATGDFLEPPDAISGATTFARHERLPMMSAASAEEQAGERLFQQNCAFCHAADGTGKNWIGTFMIPHPRDLTSPVEMSGMTRDRMQRVIRDGLPGTSMPAWGSVLSDREIDHVVAYVGKVFQPLSAEH
jgi:cytochrome c oxidase cbb3-type subunit 3